jgi:hypothetical protein
MVIDPPGVAADCDVPTVVLDRQWASLSAERRIAVGAIAGGAAPRAGFFVPAKPPRRPGYRVDCVDFCK